MFSSVAFVVFFVLSLVVQATPHSQHQSCEGKAPVTRTVVHTVTVTAKSTQETHGNQNNQVRPVVAPSNASVSASKTTSRGGVTSTASVGKGNNNNGGKGDNDKDPQKSLTLDPRVVSQGFEQNGQNPPVAGQVASLTSSNNFINFCLTVPNLPLTNGKQIQTGSCNTAPIGVIPSIDHMPSSKFSFPENFGTIKANESFTIVMNIKNMQAGFFVNAQANYFAAPQTLNGQGLIKGHSHVVIEKLDSFQQTSPTDPKTFAFFKGLNSPSDGGKLTASVDKGLLPGFYRLSSINTSSNHQPVIVPVAQHGFLDDAIYFTVTVDGKPLNNGNNGDNGANDGKTNNGGNDGKAPNDSNAGKGATTTAKGAPTPSASSGGGKSGSPPAQNNGSNNKPNNQGGSNSKPSSSSKTASPTATHGQDGNGGKLRRRVLNRL